MTPYLLFGLNGVRYAVDCGSVLEIVWLAELSPAEEAPPHIAGVINLRGKIAPVMNLEVRLGHPATRYEPGNSIIMLKADDVTIGAIVSEVNEIVEIAEQSIEPPPHYDDSAVAPIHFLAGIAKLDEDIIMLLDVARLVHAPSGNVAAPSRGGYFAPDATAAEREAFHSRARQLMRPAESPEAPDQIPLSVIQLGGERFGVALEVVREFCHLRRVTPVPCCPPHIAGNMNLRGEILTLTDIRPLLNVSAGNAAEVMVIELNDLHVGVPVDKVLEVIYPRPADITSVPAALHQERNEYCKGMLHYGEGMVSVLDMQVILARGGLEVEEEA